MIVVRRAIGLFGCVGIVSVVACGSEGDADTDGSRPTGGTAGIASGGNETVGGTGAEGNGAGPAEGAGGTGGVVSNTGSGGSADIDGNSASGGRGSLGSDEICPGGPYLPPMDGTSGEAQLVVGGSRSSFYDGPVWVASLGQLLFSSVQLQGRFGDILSYTPGASTTLMFMENARTNGLALAGTDQLIAASSNNGAVALIDLGTKLQSIGATIPGENQVSDITVRSDGTIYVSVDQRSVYRVPPSLDTDREGIWEADGPAVGVTLSPDESHLYVAFSDQVIERYPIKADSSLSQPEFFADWSGNGMVFDCAGNFYAADLNSGVVLVFDSTGEEQHMIHVADRSRGLAFGGPDRKTLFITGESLHAIELQVPGYPF